MAFYHIMVSICFQLHKPVQLHSESALCPCNLFKQICRRCTLGFGMRFKSTDCVSQPDAKWRADSEVSSLYRKNKQSCFNTLSFF